MLLHTACVAARRYGNVRTTKLGSKWFQGPWLCACVSRGAALLVLRNVAGACRLADPSCHRKNSCLVRVNMVVVTKEGAHGLDTP